MASLSAQLLEVVKTFPLDVKEGFMKQGWIELSFHNAGFIRQGVSFYFLYPVEADKLLQEKFGLEVPKRINNLNLAIVLLQDNGIPRLGFLYLPSFRDNWRLRI